LRKGRKLRVALWLLLVVFLFKHFPNVYPVIERASKHSRAGWDRDALDGSGIETSPEAGQLPLEVSEDVVHLIGQYAERSLQNKSGHS
jgi:hypothetical protein